MSQQINKRPISIVVGKGTKQAILTAISQGRMYTGELAFATDTYEFITYDGTNARVMPFVFVTDNANPDMGADQTSSRIGYGTDYITDKRISNSSIGSNANSTEGSVRTQSGVYQIYLNGTWNDIVINFRFKEDSAEGYEMEHNPVGFLDWYDIASGNSDALGLNGLPLTQNYSTVMGSYGIPLLISGGEF